MYIEWINYLESSETITSFAWKEPVLNFLTDEDLKAQNVSLTFIQLTVGMNLNISGLLRDTTSSAIVELSIIA